MSSDSISDSTMFLQGVAQFNSQEYYACHDTLEALWMEATEPDKKFYQGILQVAVGCYHLGNGNQRGASILLGEGINKLQRYEPDYMGVDVGRLIAESRELLIALQALTLQADLDLDRDPTHPSLPRPKIILIE